MKGQWIGNYSGTDTGKVFLNVDESDLNYDGLIYLTSDNPSLPIIVAHFQTKDKSNYKIEFQVNEILPIDRDTSIAFNPEGLKDKYPNASIPKSALVKGYFRTNLISFNVKTDINTKIKIKITKTNLSETSRIESEKLNWEEYKRKIKDFSDDKMVYRGQDCQNKLRTSFHRHGRYNLTRYIFEDIPRLHQKLSSITSHLFNLNDSQESGAFHNLIRHHGYPTPLLDWTYSPYVAAFFAFRNLKKSVKNDSYVRIFIFDQEKWKQDFNQVFIIERPFPHVSFIEFIAIENKRMIPQQAVNTISNVDDIEEYILNKEKEMNKKYLWAIDIPFSERKNVMSELAFMGITAGSMFPSIDGICEELREKNFQY